jgi:hypothetical protein
MILEKYEKQPAEVKDYDIDYSEWLAPMGDALQDVTTAITCVTDPTDTALVCNAVFTSPTQAKFWMAGGTDGQRYKLTAQATTQGGRLDESELIFTVKDR